MSIITHILCADNPAMGRVDKNSISPLNLMELFIGGLVNPGNVYVQSKNSFDDWARLIINDDGDVTGIHWSMADLTGFLSFQWLPTTLEELRVCDNNLCGTIPFDLFPESLIEINMGANAFSGEIALQDLPPLLEELDLSQNQFSGTLNLENLPDSLLWVYIDQNRFSGTISLTDLPAGLQWLSAGDNQLHGTINVTQLPDSMESLYIEKNAFEGKTDFSKLPWRLNWLDVSDTNLVGEILENGRTIFLVENSLVRLSKGKSS